MAGGKKSGGARTRKRVEATESAVLKRARDGSAFTRCDACGKSVSVALIDMHNCSLDDKIRSNLEAQVVEQAVEVSSKKASGGKKGKAANKEKKGKRPPSAFILFMADFRKEYKAQHPDKKSVSAAAKEGGERWNAMSDQDKKPYFDKAAELKAQHDNGERSDENNVAGDKAAGEQEVDQPPKKGSDDDDDEEEQEEEKNELDDDV
uniref:HMG box domain-containing protein n=1 Tax=Leersia perrieri TaxID=77586 RepID=A0A0D9X3D0_9ORYZ